MMCECGGMLFVIRVENTPEDLPKHRKLIYNLSRDLKFVQVFDELPKSSQSLRSLRRNIPLLRYCRQIRLSYAKTFYGNKNPDFSTLSRRIRVFYIALFFKFQIMSSSTNAPVTLSE
jgi:hypothetical protein